VHAGDLLLMAAPIPDLPAYEDESRRQPMESIPGDLAPVLHDGAPQTARQCSSSFLDWLLCWTDVVMVVEIRGPRSGFDGDPRDIDMAMNDRPGLGHHYDLTCSNASTLLATHHAPQVPAAIAPLRETSYVFDERPSVSVFSLLLSAPRFRPREGRETELHQALAALPSTQQDDRELPGTTPLPRWPTSTSPFRMIGYGPRNKCGP